jgi:hypothetical protein
MLIYVPVEVPDDNFAEFLIQSGAQLPIIPAGQVGNSAPAPQRTQRAESSGEELDPWAERPEPGGSRASRDATISPPTRGAAASRPAATPATRPPSDGDVKTVKTSFGIQTWRFPPDAPECDCGELAGLKGATSRAGKPYKAWCCAKASGDDWRNKCDYNEFTR